MSQSPKSPFTRGRFGRKENVMHIRIAVIMVALVAAMSPNASAQNGSATPAPAMNINVPAGTPMITLDLAEPGTALLAAPPPAAPAAKKPAPKADPKAEQKNCEDGGGTWDGDMPVPASQSADDERCDLEMKNEKRTSEMDGFLFCNDPDLKSGLQPDGETKLTVAQAMERFVVGEYKCVTWKARRVDLARTAAKIKAAVEAIKLPPPVDLTSLEAKDAELTKIVTAHSERLADSPECAELRTKGTSILDETDASGVNVGQAKFRACLDNPNTDPVARVGVYQAWSAQKNANEAFALAEHALDVAQKATIRFGGQVGFAGGFQPSLAEGKFILRGDRFYGGELAFAMAKNNWRFAGGFNYVSEKGHEKAADGKFKETDFAGSAIVVRIGHLWNLQGTRLSGGFTVVVRGNSTGGAALGLVDPRARSFTLGGGIGGEFAFTETFYATAAADFATVQVVGGKLSGKPASETGYSPQMLVAVGFRL